MAVTTVYGTWTTRVDDMSTSLEQTVVAALGSYASDYDTDAIAVEYRAAINDALPDGVTLSGDEFIGPAVRDEGAFDGYPLDEDGRLGLEAIVFGVRFQEIADRHER